MPQIVESTKDTYQHCIYKHYSPDDYLGGVKRIKARHKNGRNINTAGAFFKGSFNSQVFLFVCFKSSLRLLVRQKFYTRVKKEHAEAANGLKKRNLNGIHRYYQEFLCESKKEKQILKKKKCLKTYDGDNQFNLCIAPIKIPSCSSPCLCQQVKRTIRNFSSFLDMISVFGEVKRESPNSS